MNDTEILNWIVARGCSFSPGIITYYNNNNIRTIHTYNHRDGARVAIARIIERENMPKKGPKAWSQKRATK